MGPEELIVFQGPHPQSFRVLHPYVQKITRGTWWQRAKKRPKYSMPSLPWFLLLIFALGNHGPWDQCGSSE